MESRCLLAYVVYCMNHCCSVPPLFWQRDRCKLAAGFLGVHQRQQLASTEALNCSRPRVWLSPATLSLCSPASPVSLIRLQCSCQLHTSRCRLVPATKPTQAACATQRRPQPGQLPPVDAVVAMQRISACSGGAGSARAFQRVKTQRQVATASSERGDRNPWRVWRVIDSPRRRTVEKQLASLHRMPSSCHIHSYASHRPCWWTTWTACESIGRCRSCLGLRQLQLPGN